jgi:hypothetical protein
MNVLKSKDFSNLSVAQRRLVFAHLPPGLHARTRFSEEVFRFFLSRGVVGAVENPEAETTLLDGEVADLTEIAGIDA